MRQLLCSNDEFFQLRGLDLVPRIKITEQIRDLLRVRINEEKIVTTKKI
jgi:hypothetical protein